MLNVPTSKFEAWPHDKVQGELIDTEGLPFSESFFRDSFEAAVVASDEETLPYARTSSAHGRSYELAVGKIGGDRVIANALWQDRYENIYTVLTTKGNNFTDQKIFRSATAPSGYIPYGLQEGDALLRVLVASRLMREAEIDTEWIVRVLEPKKIQFEDEKVDPATFKRKLLQKIITSGLAEHEKPANSQEIHTITTALEDMSFYVTLRAMSIADRPNDFMHDDLEAAKTRLAKVLEVCNLVFFADEESVLNIGDEKHIQKYFTVLLPILIGENLAKLHNLELSHGFPTTGNVNCLGGIIDLDSVRGPALGLNDSSVTFEDYMNDIKMIIEESSRDGFEDLFYHLGKIGVLKSEDDNFMHFSATFLNSYLETRDLDPQSFEGATEILKIINDLKEVPMTDESVDLIKDAFTTLGEGFLDVQEILNTPTYDYVFGEILKKHAPDKTHRIFDSAFHRIDQNPRLMVDVLKPEELTTILKDSFINGMGAIFQDTYHRFVAKNMHGMYPEHETEEMAKSLALGFQIAAQPQIRAYIASKDVEVKDAAARSIEEYEELTKLRNELGALLDFNGVGLPDEDQIFENTEIDGRVIKLKSSVEFKDLSQALGRSTNSLSIHTIDAKHSFSDVDIKDKAYIFVSDTRLWHVDREPLRAEADIVIGGFYLAVSGPTMPTYLALITQSDKSDLVDVHVYGSKEIIESFYPSTDELVKN